MGNFLNNESKKFLKWNQRTKVLQHHINRISAAESAKSEGENIDDEANSTEINNAEGDEVTVNLTKKESSQKQRKIKRKMRKHLQVRKVDSKRRRKRQRIGRTKRSKNQRVRRCLCCQTLKITQNRL